jgi:hypothetical protein
MLEYFTVICNILQPLVIFTSIWFILSSFGIYLLFLECCTNKYIATLGVDVMCFLPQQLAFFLKTNVTIQSWHKLDVF